MSAEEVAQAGASAVSPDSDNEDVPGYKPPADKSIDDIINADQEDDSLNRYKASLGLESGAIVVFPDDPRQVIVQKLALVSEGQPDREIDLTQDLEEIKKKVIHCDKIQFFVHYLKLDKIFQLLGVVKSGF